MSNLLKSDFYRLIHSSQIKVILFSVFFYLAIMPFLGSSRLDVAFKFQNQLLFATTDCVLMVWLVSTVATAVFAQDYSCRTLKNISPYYSRTKIFLSRLIATAVSTFSIMLFWYIIGFIISLVFAANSFTIDALIWYLQRFSVQFLIVEVQTSILILLSVLIKQSAIVNLATIPVYFIYAFIPIEGHPLFHYLALAYNDGASWWIYAGLIIACCVFCLLAYHVFNKQEIRV